MKATTKRMPVSLSYGDFETKKNEFLIPAFGSECSAGFVGIKSGATYPFGAVSFIGKQITSGDIREKLQAAGVASPNMAVLDLYLEQLQSFKIGNVITVKYDSHGKYSLEMVAERPPRKNEGKLP